MDAGNTTRGDLIQHEGYKTYQFITLFEIFTLFLMKRLLSGVFEPHGRN